MLHFTAWVPKTRPTCGLKVQPLSTVRGKFHILMYSHSRRPWWWPEVNTPGQWTFYLQRSRHSTYFSLFFCGATAKICLNRHVVEVYVSRTHMNERSFRHIGRHTFTTHNGTQKTNVLALSWIGTRDPNDGAASDLRPGSHSKLIGS